MRWLFDVFIVERVNGERGRKTVLKLTPLIEILEKNRSDSTGKERGKKRILLKKG